MSAVSSSEQSNPLSEPADRLLPVSQSRLRIRLNIDKAQLATVAAEVLRLADKLMPDVPHFLISDGESMTLRVRNGDLRVCQTDILVCRLARLRGIRYVDAQQKTRTLGVVYHAGLRGRDWQVGKAV